LKRMLKIEISRAFKNKSLLFSLIIGTAIVSAQVLFRVIPLTKKIDEYLYFDKPMAHIGWLFCTWIGGNLTYPENYLFYLLFPMLATIPFADSFYCDRKSGYIKNVFIRAKKSDYYISKYIATFISGGIAIIVPLFINLAISSLILPSMLPQASAGFFAINNASMWGELFYQHPFIFIFLYMIIDFIFGGLFATISLAVGFIAEQRFIALISPFIIYLFAFSLCNMLKAYKFSPMSFLIPGIGNASSVIIFSEMLILGLITFLYFVLKGVRDDTF